MRFHSVLMHVTNRERDHADNRANRRAFKQERNNVLILLTMYCSLPAPVNATPQGNSATQGTTQTHLLHWLLDNISWILGAIVVVFSMAWGVMQSQKPSAWTLKQTFRQVDTSVVFTVLICTTVGFMTIRYMDRTIVWKQQSLAVNTSSHRRRFKLRLQDIYLLSVILSAATGFCLVYLYKGNEFTPHDAAVAVPLLFGMSAVIVDVAEGVAEARSVKGIEEADVESDVDDGLLHFVERPAVGNV